MAIVVIATTAAGVARLRCRLGSHETRVVAPSATRRVVLVGVRDEAEAERLAGTLRADGELAVTRPDDGVRLEAWRRHTRPLTFGGRLSVCFAWSEHDRRGLPGLLELGPGGFGSGEHPTTRLLLEALVDRIRGGERVLDVGCGSGVLGLGAVRLGAACVVALDVKPAAVEATRRNAAINGMADRVEATVRPPDALDGAFDVIVANVGRAAVVELAPALVGLLASGGWLAVSGISPPQCSLVANFLQPLVEVDRRTSGEWAAVVLTVD
jgi:ribosomal protein L11 methyltransferase